MSGLIYIYSSIFKSDSAAIIVARCAQWTVTGPGWAYKGQPDLKSLLYMSAISLI